MKLLPRFGAILLTLILGACEGTVDVQISATPPEDVNAAVLVVSGVSLHKEGGSTHQFTFDAEHELDMLSLARGNATSLLEKAEVPAGNYTGLSLHLKAQSQTLDSYIESSDGGEISLTLNTGASARITRDFSIRDRRDTALTLLFDLRSSLLPGTSSSGDHLLVPHLQLMDTGQSGSVSGDISAELLREAGCPTLAAEQTGLVMYAFSGNGVVADDLDGIEPEAYTTALVRSSSSADYVLGFLPQGDYTLALSCTADKDDPRSNQALEFIASRSVTVLSGSLQTLDFDPQ